MPELWKKGWEKSETVMDSRNWIYHGIENEEIYLRVVSESAGDVGAG